MVQEIPSIITPFLGCKVEKSFPSNQYSVSKGLIDRIRINAKIKNFLSTGYEILNTGKRFQ